eukprot:m.69835 g.69835  ORF g.69835 m.69835 type:complete len:126 (+) comp12242_c0_seq1:371-748(+)
MKHSKYRTFDTLYLIHERNSSKNTNNIRSTSALHSSNSTHSQGGVTERTRSTSQSDSYIRRAPAPHLVEIRFHFHPSIAVPLLCSGCRSHPTSPTFGTAKSRLSYVTPAQPYLDSTAQQHRSQQR